jgi:hypothetical protein
MKSDNPHGHNAHHPDAEAEADADDADTPSKSKIESSKAEKKPTGVAVGNKKDVDAKREEVEADLSIDILA